MTPAGHLLSGYLVAHWTPGEPSDRRRILIAGLLGSIAPDLDVVLGLLGGWAGSSAHRGATHSLLGAAVLGVLIAASVGGVRRSLFVAAFGGVLTHIFWDWLNPWGVVLLWPWMRSFRGNLVHEGNLYAVALVGIAVLLAWRGRGRAALAFLAVALPCFLLLQLAWRSHARNLAASELPGRRVAVYPSDKLRCGWIVLSTADAEMAVHCVARPTATYLAPLFQTPVRDDGFTRASEQSPTVHEFREKIPFSFAEVRPAADGGAIVVWRDLRVASQEPPGSAPTGLYVTLDAAGRILGERHRWWLSLW